MQSQGRRAQYDDLSVAVSSRQAQAWSSSASQTQRRPSARLRTRYITITIIIIIIILTPLSLCLHRLQRKPFLINLCFLFPSSSVKFESCRLAIINHHSKLEIVRPLFHDDHCIARGGVNCCHSKVALHPGILIHIGYRKTPAKRIYQSIPL